jgi:hypothetical protein
MLTFSFELTLKTHRIHRPAIPEHPELIVKDESPDGQGLDRFISIAEF